MSRGAPAGGGGDTGRVTDSGRSRLSDPLESPVVRPVLIRGLDVVGTRRTCPCRLR